MGRVSEPDHTAAAELSLGVRRLFDDAHRLLSAGTGELGVRVRQHLGRPLEDAPNVGASYGGWQHANLQRGVDAYLAAHSPDAAWFGITGQMRTHQDIVDMLGDGHGMFKVGPVDHATVAVGPDQTMRAVSLGLIETLAPDGSPIVLAMRGPVDFGSMRHAPGECSLLVLATEREIGTAVVAEVDRLMDERDVFRGQLLMFDLNEHGGNELVSFLPRPELTADQVVLPPGVLESIEKHVVRSSQLRAQLIEHGQHLKRGLLLHGAPGTGKTHTVRYLMSRLRDTTIVVLSGRALRMLPQASTLVRRLQPSVLVIEDVDLIAEDRSYSPFGAQPLLFELLNRIDGVDSDADVTFVLTTNRVDAMERALIDRPGRIDLAVEIPRPDAAGREQLLQLYSKQIALDLDDPSEVVAATEGVTASFIRELVRRAVINKLEAGPVDGPVRVDGDDLRSVLADLGAERAALTRSLLGASVDPGAAPPVAAGGPPPTGSGSWSAFAPLPGVPIRYGR